MLNKVCSHKLRVSLDKQSFVQLAAQKNKQNGNMESSIYASNASLSVKLVSLGTQLGRIVVGGGAEDGKGVSDTNSYTTSTAIGAGAV